ncbi:MAG: aminoacyl-tRNA hydrolase [Elusimicrobiales bacterium]
MDAFIFLCGLGNPGSDYLFTRHNTGYLCVDYIHKKFNFDKWLDFDSKVDYSKGFINSQRVVLLKPKEYINNSGRSLSHFSNYFKINSKDIVVIYDDVDIPVGWVRVRKKGSAGNHNGMRDIINSFGTLNISRIRIGIGPKPAGISLKDYVLGRITDDEMKRLLESFEKISGFLADMISKGIDYVISRYSV